MENGLDDRRLENGAREVLLSLYDKGPALPVELAAHCLSFPEEVAAILKELGEAGLVETHPIGRSKWGGCLIYLSDAGQERVQRELLKERI